MFSTSTTASSTNSPIAIASPPSVIVLIDNPSHLKTSIAIRIDSGMAVSEISMVRRLPRKKNSTPATRQAAISSLSCRLPIDASMKSAWRKITCGAVMPCGRLPLRSYQRRFDAFGQVDRIGRRLLLDAQDDRRHAASWRR
jgi:hypothetical protein